MGAFRSVIYRYYTPCPKMNMTYSILGYKLSNRRSNLLLRPKRTEHNFLDRVYPKYQFINRDCSRARLGWSPDWWLRSRSRSFESDRKPRPKPKQATSILKFRKLKPNPVACKIIMWKPKPKPVAFRHEKWESHFSGFGLRSRSRSQTRSRSSH